MLKTSSIWSGKVWRWRKATTDVTFHLPKTLQTPKTSCSTGPLPSWPEEDHAKRGVGSCQTLAALLSALLFLQIYMEEGSAKPRASQTNRRHRTIKARRLRRIPSASRLQRQTWLNAGESNSHATCTGKWRAVSETGAKCNNSMWMQTFMLSCTGRSDSGLQGLVYSLSELFQLYLATRVLTLTHTRGKNRRGPSAEMSNMTGWTRLSWTGFPAFIETPRWVEALAVTWYAHTSLQRRGKWWITEWKTISHTALNALQHWDSRVCVCVSGNASVIDCKICVILCVRLNVFPGVIHNG